MKVTVVGAGAVGASCAEYIAIKNFASQVVILDIKDGFAEGKAMDLMQTASLNNFDTNIIIQEVDDESKFQKYAAPELEKLIEDRHIYISYQMKL